jgi:hypothetical protein
MDYFSNWLDLIWLIDTFAIAFLPAVHDWIKLVHPTFGGLSER